MSLDQLLPRLIDVITEVLGADRATLFLYDSETEELFSRLVQGGNVNEIRIPCGAGIAGSVFTTGEALTIPDAYADPRFNRAVDKRTNYRELRELVTSYHKNYGDDITFIPGGYFANMYNSREQVNRDLHEGLLMVSEMVGDGYRPRSVIAGFLAAENQRFLAEEEGIHVCQGNIWSQYSVDKGDVEDIGIAHG